MGQLGLSEADAGKSIDVRIHQQVSLRLAENPSTGYTWSLEVPAGVEVQSSTFVPADGPRIGAGGQHVWNLKILMPGDLPIRAKLWHEWEGDQSVQRRFDVTLRAVKH